MKTVLIFGIIFVGIIVWFFISKTSTPESEIISRNGIHWHAELNINILGKAENIPANVGLFPTERYIHTHEPDNIIHMEFPGMVLEDDIKIIRFFEIWSKTFNKDCIFDKCRGPDSQLKMLVNGVENSEFENYVMRDGDKIEIIFSEAEMSQVREFLVSGGEFSFNPSDINVRVGERVRIVFDNQGRASHNLIIENLGVGTKLVAPGQTDVIEFMFPAAGTYGFFCSVPGHRSAGMEGQLIVE